MTWMPWAILSGLVLEAISHLIERHAVHPEPYQHPIPFRVLQWGTLSYSIDDGPQRRWFFAMKLPSWQWESVDYGRHAAWCQLHLVWIEGEGWSRTGYYNF